MNTRCQKCERLLPAGHVGGNCPACLLTGALFEEPNSGLAGNTEDIGPSELGDYEILGEIGRGGTSVVYRARQRTLNRIVALKTLHNTGLTSRDAFERLQVEAQAVARLDNPHIVPLYEVGRVAGIHFLALRYFEHGSLSNALKSHRYTPTEAARFIQTAAIAVHHAHSRGVLHRDLKPSNFLLDAEGAPHITDFGLAKLADSDSSLTLSTSVLGTPAYMAPEQANGKAKETGTPADIYSLGAVLFELLTGRPPFIGRSALEVLRHVADSEPPAPRSLNPDVDPDLEAICLHCLEKDPGSRYTSAAALAEDLDRWLRHQPISIRPPTVPERVIKWSRRHPAVAFLTGLIALSVVAGVLGTAWQWRRVQVAQIETARRNYAASLALADQYIQEGDISRAKVVLKAQPEQFRGWEWGFLMSGCYRELFRAEAYPRRSHFTNVVAFPEVGSLEVSAGGRFIALWERGVLVVFDAPQNRRLFELGRSNQPVRTVAFHPEGRELAVIQETAGCQIFDTEHWKVQRQIPATQSPLSGIAYSPDGKALLCWDTQGTVLLRDTASLAPIRTFEFPESSRAEFKGYSYRFSVDGSRIFAASLPPFSATHRPPARGLPFWERATGRWIASAPQNADGLVQITPDPDGQHFATLDTQGIAALWRLGDSKPLFQTPADHGTSDGRKLTAAIPCAQHHRLLTIRRLGELTFWDTQTAKLVNSSSTPTFAWNPDRTHHLVTMSTDWSVHRWDWVTGKPVQQYPTGNDARSAALRVDPTGKVLVASVAHFAHEIEAIAWPIHTGTDRLTADAPVYAARISPDGSRIAGSHLTGDISLWDSKTGGRTHTLRGHDRWVLDLAWSGDNRFLFTAGADHQVTQWNPATGEAVQSFKSRPRPVASVTANFDGSQIATRTFDGAVVLWDTSHRRILRTLEQPSFTPPNKLSFSPDGQWLCLMQAAMPSKLYRTQNYEEATEIPQTPNAHGMFSHTHAFSPDSTRIALCDMLGNLEILELKTWRHLLLRKDLPPASDLLFSADGSRLFLATLGYFDGFRGRTSILVIDAETGQVLLRTRPQNGWTPCLSLTSDGQQLVRAVIDISVGSYGADHWTAFPWEDRLYRSKSEPSAVDPIDVWAKARNWEQARQIPTSQPGEIRVKGSPWPRRDERTPAGCIDLSEHYNGRLDIAALAMDFFDLEDLNLSALPRGLVSLDGVSWDIRGLISTSRPEAKSFRIWKTPEAVPGIRVGRRGRSLHFLHATWHEDWQSPTWGRYRLHYVDGTTADIPLKPGIDIGMWIQFPDRQESGIKPAWEGTFERRLNHFGRPRLFHLHVANPKPELEILTVDLLNDGSAAAPFAVALTLEE